MIGTRCHIVRASGLNMPGPTVVGGHLFRRQGTKPILDEPVVLKNRDPSSYRVMSQAAVLLAENAETGASWQAFVEWMGVRLKDRAADSHSWRLSREKMARRIPALFSSANMKVRSEK